jgi:hypothetical protein
VMRDIGEASHMPPAALEPHGADGWRGVPPFDPVSSEQAGPTQPVPGRGRYPRTEPLGLLDGRLRANTIEDST